tara:strand:- start:9828 stop:11663 length:1836 start_codon:yes stop_codon:yes gene_type:complete
VKIIKPMDLAERFTSTAPPDSYSQWEPIGRDFFTEYQILHYEIAAGYLYMVAKKSFNPSVVRVDLATGESGFLAANVSAERVVPSPDGSYLAVEGRNVTAIYSLPLMTLVYVSSQPLLATCWSYDSAYFCFVAGDFPAGYKFLSAGTWDLASQTASEAAIAGDLFGQPAHDQAGWLRTNVLPSATSQHLFVLFDDKSGQNLGVKLLKISMVDGSYISAGAATRSWMAHNVVRGEILVGGGGDAGASAFSDATLAAQSGISINALPASLSADLDGNELIVQTASVQPYFRRYSATDYTSLAALDVALPTPADSVKYSANYYVSAVTSGGYALIDRTDDTAVTVQNPDATRGDIYTYSDRNYEALTDNSARPDQGAIADPPTWLDLGPTNPLRMFDGKLDTLTTAPDVLTVEITPSQIANGLALFNASAQTVRITMTDDAEGLVYDSGEIQMLENADVRDWYAYFFDPYSRKSDLARIDLPPYADAVITVTLTAQGEQVSVGQLVLGTIQNLGQAVYGTSVGITDFSRKEPDIFGNFEIVERRFSKRAEYDVVIDTRAAASVQRTLAAFRAKPVVWIGAEDHEETIVYGYYRDFDIVIANYSTSDATITVEGL